MDQAISFEGLPEKAVQPTSKLWRQSRKFWCRKFHRQHHQKQIIKEDCVKVRCCACGHCYLRERHVTYVVW